MKTQTSFSEPAMKIQTTPQSAMLSWPGLSALPIPPTVLLAAEGFEIQINRDGIDQLPPPLNKADCWVSCRESWPHSDPDFEGYIFITLALRADHRYCQLLVNHTHSVRGVFPGVIFTTDPLSLHWLAPNMDNGSGFVGLQFEVAYHEADTFYGELLEKLAAIGPVVSHEPELCQALLVAQSEYVGAPPGPLAERILNTQAGN
ncbi:hypothetical protein [Pseudomonas syringae]|uniref:hypothetical protein n=1 Tax=Pseudomonas syringae TaxID=317 RepID=UPI001F226161|nr:hypothetical protein [Pseudomonas syringae]MCF5372003.1 hypothetical protein [Pseudomonas syringae]